MMKNSFRKWLSFVLCAVLIAAMALVATGCKPTVQDGETVIRGGETLGTGSKTFTFTVVDVDGKEVTATIKTDEKFVGDALMAHGLLEGENGPYGLYVKAVNGQVHEYENGGKYWAFYEGDVYATTGVDMTEVKDGAAYTMKVE